MCQDEPSWICVGELRLFTYDHCDRCEDTEVTFVEHRSKIHKLTDKHFLNIYALNTKQVWQIMSNERRLFQARVAQVQVYFDLTPIGFNCLMKHVSITLLPFRQKTPMLEVETIAECWLNTLAEPITTLSLSSLLLQSSLSLLASSTHWGRVTHICVSKLTIVGSDNGLSPDRRQAIIWTNAGLLLIGPLGTNFSEILIGIEIFSFRKKHLKMSSAKWRPFCLGLNVLMWSSLLSRSLSVSAIYERRTRSRQ